MKAGEPRVLSEPGEVTDVVDAFDGDDVFDLHLTLGYQYLEELEHPPRDHHRQRDANPGLRREASPPRT